MMRNILIMVIMLYTATTTAQVTTNDVTFDPSTYEIVEVMIHGSLAKGIRITADGQKIKKVKYTKGWKQRKRTSWILLLKKSGFKLTHSEVFGDSGKRPTTILIFEKQQ